MYSGLNQKGYALHTSAVVKKLYTYTKLPIKKKRAYQNKVHANKYPEYPKNRFSVC